MIDHYSVSSINQAASCPRGWWVKYVLKQEQPSSDAASFGTQYDQVVSQRLGCIAHKESKMGGLIEGVEEAVSGYLCQPHALKSATHAQVPINITQGQWGVMAEIHGFYAEIKHPIVGFIDLYDAANRTIVDLKTSKSKRTTPGWAMQVLIYALAKQANSARIHLMTRTKVPAYYDFNVPVTRDSYRWAMQLFTYWANQIDQWIENGAGDELPRLPDYHCSWCPEALVCPATNLLVEF